VSDVTHLESVIRDVIAANPAAVTDYQSGKKAAIGFLIGQVMKQMRGTANPAVARQLLTDILHQAQVETD
jgi:aspartyl-tRNA(Asn)/glutamyl-tRNA(Gln) amidotransferase subunit B